MANEDKVLKEVETLIKNNGINDETFKKVRELDLDDMDKIRAIRYYKQCRIELENLDPEDKELAKLTKKLRDERMRRLGATAKKVTDKVTLPIKGTSFTASKVVNTLWKPLKDGWCAGAK